jgi:ABC-2 type transport system permease protein
MAVYEQSYKPYEGRLTPSWSRFLVIPRRAFKGIFRSKLFTGFFALTFVPTLIFAIVIYLKHNVTAMSVMELRLADIVPIDAYFFRMYVEIQCYLALMVTIATGPGLVASDLANNALPLYLARPISRAEYALGKMMALFALLSSITWIPGLVLYTLAAYLEGWGWFVENVRTGVAIFVGSWVWIVTVTLLALAVSTLVKQAMAARGTLVGIFFALSAFAAVVNESFETNWGYVVSLVAVSDSIWVNLFGDSSTPDLPAVAAWIVTTVVCATSLALLSRRIRAYEVVT